MKKIRAIAAASLIICIIIAACLVVFAVPGGVFQDNAERITLDKDRYVLYLDGEKTASPVVSFDKKQGDYTLASSNVTIFVVGENGVITGLKEGIAKLTAVSGDTSATAAVIVYTSKTSPLIPKEEDGKLLIVFVTEQSAVPAQRVAHGEKAVLPEQPFVPDQVIEGWYTDAARTVQFDFNTPITSDITLYAKWTAGENPTYTFKTLPNGTHTVDKLKYPLVAFKTLRLPSADYDGKPVTAVNSKAFQDNTSVETVIIPKEIETIKDYAFAGCTNLKEVIFEDGSKLKAIEDEAFWKCGSLQSITLPGTLSSLGAGVFNACEKLSSVNLPQSITVLQKQVFAGTAIEAIDLSNITTLKFRAFYGATKLAAISNSDKLTLVEAEVFSNTAWLKNEFNSADGVAYLGAVLITRKPANTASFFDITVKDGTKLIANNALYDFTNYVIRLNMPLPPTRGSNAIRTEGGNSSSITANKINIVVPYSAYGAYKSQWSINANQIYYKKEVPLNPGTLELFVRQGFSYSNSAPKDCAVLFKYSGVGEADLDITELLEQNVGQYAYLERIRANAFYQDTTLKSVILPVRLGEIESYAFNNCTRLSSIKLEGYYDSQDLASNTKLETKSCFNNASSDLKIYLPSERLSQYASLPVWSTLWSTDNSKNKLIGYP